MNQLKRIMVPLLSVLLGLLLGAIIMYSFGFDALNGYMVMLKGAFGTPFFIGETLRNAAPLIVIALGFSVAYTAGFFNIGLSGQAVCGWLASVWVGLLFPDLPKFILLPLAILAGMIAGAIWAGIAGVLKAYFNTSEVIVTIMLNHTAFFVSNYIVRNVMTEQADSTAHVGENASMRLQWLTQMTQNSTLHMGIFISLVMVLIMYWLMQKTNLGFEIKAVGLNKHASDYAGISTKQVIITSMLISGALAGLGGSMEGLGNFRNIFIFGSLPSIGFDGLAVSLLGAGNPIGILFSGLLFGVLRVGGNSMPLSAQIPSEVVGIVSASIIFFVGSSYVIRFAIDKFNAKNVKAKVGD